MATNAKPRKYERFHVLRKARCVVRILCPFACQCTSLSAVFFTHGDSQWKAPDFPDKLKACEPETLFVPRVQNRTYNFLVLTAVCSGLLLIARGVMDNVEPDSESHPSRPRMHSRDCLTVSMHKQIAYVASRFLLGSRKPEQIIK